MYGLAHDPHHFSSFDGVQSLPNILAQHNIRTGIVGKYHVAPASVYRFEYDASSARYDVDQVGRNITCMRQHVRQFLQQSRNDTRPFFLYVAWHDPHRCGGKFGQFCEKFGNGQPGMGLIPDWTPRYYNPGDVKVPYYLPDTPATRQDLANMYTTYSRMDQGLGLFMRELDAAGFLDNTLVLYTSDNGIPFPNAKTTLYEPGMGEPMMISNPHYRQHWGVNTDALASIMDFTPTVLDWFGIPPGAAKVKLTGKSLLPVTKNPTDVTNYSRAFASHNFHEVTMNYPMRVVRTPRYRLIHNLNHHSPYGIATDIYNSPTFQDILNRTLSHRETRWFKTLAQYYHRPQYELFDLQQDPQELVNLASDPRHRSTLNALKVELEAWQTVTRDPWRCLPAEELIEAGGRGGRV
nr:hypothetical protein BaRGS_020028 [Batillaria attramentaria]